MSRKLVVKNKIESDRNIKVAPFRKDIRKTSPHKHNSYFEIVYLSAGKGYHTIDSKKYAVKPPVLFCIRKEQVHHWELNKIPEGYVLILKKSFVDQTFDVGLRSLLEKLSNFTCLSLSDQHFIDTLFSLLVEENKSGFTSTPEITEGLLKSLLAKILLDARPQSGKEVAKSRLYQSFRELLGETRVLQNNVAQYARLLNTTPQNLNAACRKAVNQSASDILAEFIISDAKRMLIYTSQTVSEISFALNFKDVSHFVKYFRRFTGSTPQSFRNIPE